MNFILHIGTHKTGTTTIQKFLSHRTKEMEASGLLYPESGRKSPAGKITLKHGPLAWSIQNHVKKNAEEVPEVWEKLFQEARDKGFSNIVVSVEHFSQFNLDETQFLAQILKGHATKVVLYLRNPFDFLSSSYAQELKRGKTAMKFPAYVRKNIQRCHYKQILDNWLVALNPQKGFEIRIYDLVKDTHGVLADFLKIIEFPAPDLGKKGPFENRSPQTPTLHLLRLINVASVKLGLRLKHTLRLQKLVWNPKSMKETLLGRILGTLYGQQNLWTKNLEKEIDLITQWNLELATTYLETVAKQYVTLKWHQG